MNRIEAVFHQRKPFIGYLTAGDGGIDYSTACALAMIEGGVDILELGLPFSDPVGDGPVIQKASQRALSLGMQLSSILEIAKQIRQVKATPLVLFSYFNPLYRKGSASLKAIKAAGFDAVLVLDLPPLHPASQLFFADLQSAGLLPISMVTPSTDEQRLFQICAQAKGFIYYASQKGTTGIRSSLADDFVLQIARIRQHTSLPIAAGFGIANQTSARQALGSADGFVVGSAFVKLMEEHADPSALHSLAQSLDPRGSR